MAFPGNTFSNCEVSIGAVRNYSLTWRQPQLLAIEFYRDNVGLE
jgi:hypothetical protein